MSDGLALGLGVIIIGVGLSCHHNGHSELLMLGHSRLALIMLGHSWSAFCGVTSPTSPTQLPAIAMSTPQCLRDKPHIPCRPNSVLLIASSLEPTTPIPTRCRPMPQPPVPPSPLTHYRGAITTLAAGQVSRQCPRSVGPAHSSRRPTLRAHLVRSGWCSSTRPTRTSRRTILRPPSGPGQKKIATQSQLSPAV